MEKTPLTTAEIRLCGHRVALKTSDNDPDFTAEVIELVSTRIETVESRITGTKVPHQITLLALLELAEEYVRAKKRTADYKAEIESRSQELLQSLGAGETSAADAGVPTA